MSKENSTLNLVSDLDDFKAKILEHIKAGKPLNGKDGKSHSFLTNELEALTIGQLDLHFEGKLHLPLR